MLSFDRDAFCQVSGHVRVKPAFDRQIIGQELSDDDIGNDRPFLRVFDRDVLVKYTMGFVGDPDDIASPRFHLHRTRQIGAECFVAGCKHNARRAFFDQSERAVLEFTGSQSLRVYIGNLLDFERSFQTCRIG